MAKEDLRTLSQNRALHKWYGDVAQMLNERGVSPRVFIDLGVEISFTKDMVKQVWKEVQASKYGKDSTRKISREELQEIYDDIDRELLSNPQINIDVPFPNIANKLHNESAYEHK